MVGDKGPPEILDGIALLCGHSVLRSFLDFDPKLPCVLQEWWTVMSEVRQTQWKLMYNQVWGKHMEYVRFLPLSPCVTTPA